MANIIPGVTTAQQAADIINLDRAKVGGDSSQDFAASKLIIKNAFAEYNNIHGFSITGENGTINSFSILSDVGNPIMAIPKNTLNAVFSANVTAQSFTPFTGCHIIPKENHNFKIGELVCIEAIESEDKKQPDWRGRYAKKGEQGIFGIVFDEYEEPKLIPEVGVNKFYSIACLGDMKVLCNGENGNIKYGDELCASSKSGVAMKFTGGWKDRKQICGKAGRSHAFINDEVVLIDTTKE